MFEARHGRGAVDNLMATSGMVSTTIPITVPTQAESVSIRVTDEGPRLDEYQNTSLVVYSQFLVNQVKLP